MVAAALASRGWLALYETSYIHDDSSRLATLARRLPGTYGHRLLSLLQRRRFGDLDAGRVSTNLPLAAAMVLGRSLPPSLRPAPASLEGWFDRWFDRATSRGFPENTNLFYGVEGSCTKTISRAHREGIATILEGTVHPVAEATILQPEYEGLGLRFPATQPSNVLKEIDTADLVVSQSDFGRSTYCSAGVPCEKVATLALGVDTSFFHPAPKVRVAGGPLRVLYVGSLAVRKGVHHLLAAIQLLPDDVARLTLVGTMRKEFLPIWRRMAPAMKNRAHWRGGIAHANLPAVYREADVVVLPSLCDSFGQVVVEALACGTPVIATTNCGALPRPEIDGLIVAPGDPQSIAKAIQRLRIDTDLLHRMARRAPEGVRTWGEFQTDFLAIAMRIVRDEG
jgi:glycosyltransferase involved in cell wall biosynthesis